MTSDTRPTRVRVLSKLADSKYTRLREAVFLSLAGMALLALTGAAVATAVL